MAERENPQESEFVLRSGMYPSCAGIYDEITNRFTPSDLTSVAKCCTDYCIKTHTKCAQLKNDPSVTNDIKKCNKIRELCMGACLIDSEFIGESSIYAECTENPGQTFYECCRETCIPNKYINCQTYCEFADQILKDPTYASHSIYNPNELHNIIHNSLEKSGVKWLVYTIIIFSLCIVGWIIFTKIF